MPKMVELLPGTFINLDQIQSIEIHVQPAIRKFPHYPQGKNFSVKFVNPNENISIFIADVPPPDRTDKVKQMDDDAMKAARILEDIARGTYCYEG